MIEGETMTETPLKDTQTTETPAGAQTDVPTVKPAAAAPQPDTQTAQPTAAAKPTIKRFPFTSKLGWSASRYDKFSTCKRQYYYEYYGKHDPEFKSRKIHDLKDLTSIPIEIGSIVHHVIKILLQRLKKTAQAIDRTRFFDYAKRTTERFCRTKKFTEVHYGEKETVDADTVYKTVETCLRNFLDTDRYNWIFTDALGGIDSWIIEPPGFGEARINDFKVYCKVDFLFPVGDTIYIIDWKTGKAHPEKHRNQILGYASWASYHFEKAPETIVPVIAYLNPSYSEMITEFNEFDIQDFTTQVEEQTEEMHAYCKDVEENIPLEKCEFSKTKITRICDFCNFRELCQTVEEGDPSCTAPTAMKN